MSTLTDLARTTPASRERTIDFLRALSIGVVVCGHWLMAAVTFHDGSFAGGNALASMPKAWILTWFLQVMPIFFFVGGFSNLTSWRSVEQRGGGYAGYLTGRVRRLMKPTAMFAGVWLAMAFLLSLAGLPEGALTPMAAMMGQPLWFIGVYIAVVAAAPPMIRLHRRFGPRAALALLASAAAVDVAVRVSGVGAIAYLNGAFVWLFAHQLGFLYADGTLLRWGRRAHAAIAASGLLGLIALTASGLYPASMVGLPGGPSNMNPPSFALVALTLWLVGLAMLARPRVEAWLQRPRAWAAVIGANSVMMTSFLWHQTALLLGIGILLPLGFPQPEVGSAAWWATRPLWLGALVALLAPLVMLFARVERAGLTAPRVRGRVDARAAAAGVGLVSLGVLGFAGVGFAPGAEGEVLGVPVTPLRSALAFAAGLALLRTPEASEA